MAYQNVEIKKFLGLYLQANSLVVPDGAMERATNIIIQDDDVIQKIKGFYQYYAPSGVTLNALFNYQSTLMAAFTDRLAYFTNTGSSPNQTGTKTDLSGKTFVITAPAVARSVQQSENMYVTSDNGVMKIDAYDAKVYTAGAPPGLDLRGILAQDNGILTGNSQVAYRVVFGREDANDNTILGAPSDILVLTNALVTSASYTNVGAGSPPYRVIVESNTDNLAAGLVITVSGATNAAADGVATIVAVTAAKSVTGATYSSTGAGTWTVTVNSTAHGLAVGMRIVVTGASDTHADGTHNIATVAANSFTYTVTSGNPNSGTLNYTAAAQFTYLVSGADPASGSLNFAVTRQPTIQFSVPRELTDSTEKWFYQVYRTTISSSDSTSPEVDFRKIDQQYLTPDQLTAGVVNYTDTISQILVTYAPELYTNPNSGEGEAQTNTRPPKCDDVTLFQGYVFYAKCTTRHFVNVDVVAPTNIAQGDTVTIRVGALDRVYVAREGVGNSKVKSDSASFVTTTITVNYVAHGLLAGYTILVSNAIGTGTLPSGTYTIATAGADSFTFTAAVAPTTLTDLDFEGVTNGTNYIFQLDKTNASVANQLSNTARGLVKAVNRDTSAVIYANYVSGITDIPGKMRFTAMGFGSPIFLAATSPGTGYSPALPASFVTGNQVFSRNENQKNAIYISKFQEPEAAPAANAVFVGSRNAAILRAIALRNSVIVLKEDGVFKITGDSPRNFSATLLDNTVVCIAANSAAPANNTVYFLASEGVSAATDSAVEIISRKIENVIEPVAGKALIASETAGIGYDSNRTYRLSTIGPNDTTRTVTYLYNFLNDTWTDSDYLFKGGVIGPMDALYIIDGSGNLQKERKTQTKIDYCGQNYAVTVVSVDADKLGAVITMSTPPVAGDVIVKSNVITRIDTVTTEGSVYVITFVAQCNLVAADSVILYKAYTSRWDFAPLHGGAIGIEKQFAQLQAHTRDNGVFQLTITFQNTYFGGSEITTWKRYLVQSYGGWGEFPWGFEVWGQEEGIDLAVATLPAPPIRIYIPQFAQRATFIKSTFEHSEACDPINIQALALSVRSYAERVAK